MGQTEGRAPDDDIVAGADPPAGVLADAGAERRFLTADDGVRLHYLAWPTGPSPPWAIVIFLHGIASHAGWFAQTAAHLNDHGVAVWANQPAWLAMPCRKMTTAHGGDGSVGQTR